MDCYCKESRFTESNVHSYEWVACRNEFKVYFSMTYNNLYMEIL